jgi:hypothetical protein
VDSEPLLTLLTLVAVFSVGIVISMSLFGIVFARAMSVARAVRLGRAAASLMAVISIVLGIFWIALA